MSRPGSRLRVIRLLIGTFALAAVGGLLARCALDRGQARRNAATASVGRPLSRRLSAHYS